MPKIACSWEFGGEFYAPYLEVTYFPPASIDEYDFVEAVNIYPNPVEDNFTIWYVNLKQGEYDVQILDLQGKSVARVFTGSHTNHDLELNLSTEELGLSQGMYVARLSGENNVINHKVIVR